MRGKPVGNCGGQGGRGWRLGEPLQVLRTGIDLIWELFCTYALIKKYKKRETETKQKKRRALCILFWSAILFLTCLPLFPIFPLPLGLFFFSQKSFKYPNGHLRDIPDTPTFSSFLPLIALFHFFYIELRVRSHKLKRC